MANQNKAIGSFDIIRKLVRNLYLEGFNNYLETQSLGKSSRAFTNNLNSIKNFLDERFLFSKTSTKKKANPVIAFDTRNETENPLYSLWKTANSLASNLSFDFAIMDILEENPEGIGWFSLTSDSNSSKHESILNEYVSKGTDKKSVKAKLERLAEAGLIEFFEGEKKIRKNDTSAIKKLLSSKESKQAVQFASETCPLGVIGSYILDNLKSLDVEPVDAPVHYKHHFIFGSIDCEIMYVLLESITHKNCAQIETESHGVRTIVPIKIFTSTQTGRNYVIFWDFQTGRFFSENLESILSAKKSDSCPEFTELREKFLKIEPRLWGISFKNNGEFEHVRFVIEYTAEESYIPARIEKEASAGSVMRIDETHSEFTADLLDSRELNPWIRSFFGRITELESPYAEKIKEDLNFLIEGKFRETSSDSKNRPSYKVQSQPGNTPLFDSLYSTYYLVAKKVAEFCILNPEKDLDREILDAIIGDTGFVSDRIELYNLIEYSERNENRQIFTQSGDKITTNLKHIPDFPLSKIELRFLASIIRDSKVTMFMDSQTVEKLKIELKDVAPLWTKDDIKYYDQNKDADDFDSDDYRKKFRTILTAIKDGNYLHLVFKRKGNSGNFTPMHMDYSQKDNLFRLFVKEQKYPINLRNIKSCSITEEIPSEPEESTEHDTLTVEFFDDTKTKYHFNRAIRQFSYFKKTCRKTEKENIYEMTVDYDKSDESEIVIRVLMFAPNMRVLAPESVVSAVEERISKQARLFSPDGTPCA